MSEIKPEFIKAHTPCVFFHHIIPSKLIDLMVEEVDKMEEGYAPTISSSGKLEGAKTGNLDEALYNKEVRNSKIGWWFESHWVSSIFSHYIAIANKQQWEYDLNVLLGIQVSTYEAPDGHYKWHSDYGTSKNNEFTRKLSASLLLTDPEDYEGGDLEFIDYHGNNILSPKERGSIIVFDSRIPHRVTPVTKGKRCSLVTWMYGPKLR